ncbi:MAG: hypothetical protein J6W49_04705 [Paludibacteraceae bacterium]|nr:hypothetical protein [Paludibacteraceae bacterium]MBP5742721.1 hypothetical protein [Paludibacteraceae bacterium]
MAKIILNGCFGGYSWSDKAIQELSEIKGKKVNSREWLLREDPDAIALIETKGSKYCSGIFAELYVEEYDEELWIPDIHEYDGTETLDLTPRLTEKQIRACKNMDEVVELLKARDMFNDRNGKYSFIS